LKSLLVIVVIVVISFFHYLNEKTAFAIFANELFIFSGVEFAGTEGAERDFSAHVVLDTRMNF